MNAWLSDRIWAISSGCLFRVYHFIVMSAKLCSGTLGFPTAVLFPFIRTEAVIWKVKRPDTAHFVSDDGEP